MPKTGTEIHLVRDLEQGLELAHSMGAKTRLIDLEGTLFPFVGNTPDPEHIEAIMTAPNLAIMRADIIAHPNLQNAIETNNRNIPNPFPGHPEFDDGIVTWAGRELVRESGLVIPIPVAYKGMVTPTGKLLREKPKGDQSRYNLEELEAEAEDTILMDDQGVKNAGEAIKAGLKAIIVPNPIGFVNGKGKVIENDWVMRFRNFEPAIYRSLEKRGNLAGFAYKFLAGVELSQISDFVDHREK